MWVEKGTFAPWRVIACYCSRKLFYELIIAVERLIGKRIGHKPLPLCETAFLLTQRRGNFGSAHSAEFPAFGWRNYRYLV